MLVMSALDNHAPWPARRMRDCGVLHRKIWAGNQAIDAWDGGTVGQSDVINESPFPRVLAHGYADWTSNERWERKAGKCANNECVFDFFL